MSIIGMKINSFKIKKKGLMRNLIGREIKQIGKIRGLKRYNSYSRSKKYNYGKKVVKDGRKMGHINFTET
jgi:phosphoribosylaminoimidazole carboxylase (NCAIR synthetase)